MKKWLSRAVICTLLAASLSISGTENIAKADANSLEGTVDSVTDLDQYENNDLIVVYKDKSMSEKKMAKKTVNISELAEDSTMEQLTDNSMIIKLDSKQELEEAIETYSNNSSVAYVQPNYIYHTLTDVTITDTDYQKQWGMNNDGTYTYRDTVYSLPDDTGRLGGQRYTSQKITIKAQEGIDADAEEAWSLGTGADREVVVAFIDTGIKYDHEELADYMWVNPNEIAGDGIDNDGNGYVDDIHGWNFHAADQEISGSGWDSSDDLSNGNNTYYNADSTEEDSHATHCAGTVAAQADGTGVVGIAHQQNVKIMTIKVLGGNDGTGTTESVVKGIKYAADNGANICNLSLGGTEDDQALREVIEENSDMLFCVAAGNGDRMNIGYDMDEANAEKAYPACYEYDNIITVANMQCDGKLHYSSNYGKESVDIAAPGTQIYSTSTANSGYEYMTGTSMAAPVISGIAAMLYSYYDDVTIYDVKDMILNSAKQLTSLEGKVACGGMADAYAALMQRNAISLADIITENPASAPANSTMPMQTEEPFCSEQPNATEFPGVIEMPTVGPEITAAPVSAAPANDEKATLGTPSDYKLDNAQIILKTNKKAKLVVHDIPSTIKVTWKSAEKSIATITGNGMITAKAPGKSVITAVLSTGKRLSCMIVVQPVTPSCVKTAQVSKKLKVRIKWGKVTGIDGYEVLRATSKNGRYRVIKDVKKAGTKYYVDQKVARRTYYYKVRAYKEMANGSRIYSTSSSARKIKIKKT